MTAGQPLRVLLVTSDPEVLEAMQRAFGTDDFEIAGEAWPGIDAARRTAALVPEVVVLHIEEPIAPAIRTVKAIAEACPQGGLAVISSSTDLEVVRKVMNAGAHDFASLPLADEALRDAASRAASSGARRASNGAGPQKTPTLTGIVITVVGPRGGVGKTTFASNLALSLAQETGTAVGLVDLDVLFGGAAIALDMLPEAGLQEWLRTRSHDMPAPVARYLSAHDSGLRLLAAPVQPDPDIEFTPTDVADLLADLSSTHEFIVLDTPAGFTEVTAAAIEIAPLTMMLTTPEVSSLRAVRFLTDTLRSWDIDDERLRVVLNHPTPLTGISADEVREAVGLAVSWDLPHDSAVLRAAAAGVPACDFKPNAPFARQVRNIARFLAGVGSQQPSRSKVLGIF